MKNKKLYFELLIQKKKEQNLDFEVTRYIFYWNEILYDKEFFEKIADMLGFVILDIVVALNGHCLWSWDYSAHALH